MKETIVKEKDVIAIKEIVKEKTALVFSQDKQLDLKHAIIKTIEKFGIPSVDDLVRHLAQGISMSNEFNFLIENLTINETYFFRHFSALENYILPELLKAKRNKEVKIWSAGCSSGEEAYSISMVLHELLNDINMWNIKIKASDIDQSVIASAKKGIYKRWSMRQISDYYLEKYFTINKEDLYEINPEIKKNVDFSLHNLQVNDYPSALNETEKLDLILCRNVTIYFDTDTTIEIVNRFYRCLKMGGYLIVGHSEPSPFIYEQFEHMIMGDMVVYRKSSSKKSRLTVPILDREFPLKKEKKNDKVTIKKAHEKATIELKAVKKEEKTESSLEKAYEEYKKHNYDDAITELHLLLAKDSNHSEANYLMALIYANLHRLSEAVAFAKKVVKQDALHQDAYYLLALIAKEDKNHELAIEHLKKALYINSEFILAYYELIVNHVLLDQNDEAERLFKQVKKLILKKNDDDDVGIVEHLKIKNLKSLLSSFLKKTEF